MRAIWTDLAMEAKGSPVESEQLSEGIERTVVRIEDDRAERELGRPKGTYVTLSCPQSLTIDLTTRKRLSEELARTLRDMLPAKARTVLVTGLGNRSVTPDALGPRTVERVVSERLGEMIVTPREVDSLVIEAAAMVAGGLNRALHPQLSEREIHAMMET